MNRGQCAQDRLSDIARCSVDREGVTRFPFTSQHEAALDVRPHPSPSHLLHRCASSATATEHVKDLCMTRDRGYTPPGSNAG